ncbi:MAG: DUF1629 domain-containing protein [Hyphomicrobium sp.]|jgi:hypothetical protein
MEQYQPRFDPYRDLKRGEQRECTYQPGDWQGAESERSPYVRFGLVSVEAGGIDWINDPNLGVRAFGDGRGFSRLPERPKFKLKASDAPTWDFHWFSGFAIVSKRWIDFCLEVDPSAIEFIPVQILLSDGQPTEEQFYAWDVVRVIDAIDWGRTKATVIKGEIDGEDYVYLRDIGPITLRPDIDQRFHLFLDRVSRAIVFCTRVFEQEAMERGLRGYSMGDLRNYPHTGRKYYESSVE